MRRVRGAKHDFTRGLSSPPRRIARRYPDSVTIIFSELRAPLKAAGLDLDTDKRHWLDAEYILLSKHGELTQNVKVNDQTPKCLIFPRAVLDGE